MAHIFIAAVGLIAPGVIQLISAAIKDILNYDGAAAGKPTQDMCDQLRLRFPDRNIMIVGAAHEFFSVEEWHAHQECLVTWPRTRVLGIQVGHLPAQGRWRV